ETRSSTVSWPSALTKTVDVGRERSLSDKPSRAKSCPTQLCETMTFPFCFHSSKCVSCWDRFPTSHPLLDALMMTLAPESISPLSVEERNEVALFPESWRLRYRCQGLTVISAPSC